MLNKSKREKKMEDTRTLEIKEEEEDAEFEIWSYILGFVKMAVVKCAIDLGIAEAIENHGSSMTISELSSTLRCDPSLLQRIMRFLVHHRIFKEKPTSQGSIAFEQTLISRRLMRHGQNSMAAYVLLESSPAMVDSMRSLSAYVLSNRASTSAFELANGKDIWSYSAADASQNNIFNDAMACSATKPVSAIIEGCPEVFDGLETLVDVGGGDGTAINMLVKAFPWIKGINFDLPHVVDVAEKFHGVELVGGDMFERVPKADAVLIKRVLHDWEDDDCIKILKNCREAIPKDKGKVMIVESIIEEEEGNKFKSVRLTLDIMMMAYTNKGKERTLKEWEHVLRQAGFNRYNVKPVDSLKALIEAFPN